MSILEKLTKRQETRQQTVAEQYRKLLARLATVAVAVDEPTEKDVEQLDNLTSQLRYDRSQVADDLEIIRRVKELEPLVQGEPEWRANLDVANKAWHEHSSHCENEAERLRLENVQLSAVRGTAYVKHQASQTAMNEIADLKRKSPNLF